MRGGEIIDILWLAALSAAAWIIAPRASADPDFLEIGDFPNLPDGLRSPRGNPGGMGDARRPLGYATRQHDGTGV